MLRFSRIYIILFAVIVLTGGCIANNQTETVTKPKDETPMVLVPESYFIMGFKEPSEKDTILFTVWVDDFFIDRFEVTNSSYMKCVDEGGCKLPDNSTLERIGLNDYFRNSKYQEYPVTQVTWEDADTYCKWRGARLPTEAEWEKAARGTEYRAYPWGEELSCEFANYGEITSACVIPPGPLPVGSYLKGISPYGVHDMAGNVYEFVEDCYYADPTIYISEGIKNPLVLEFEGCSRVIHGGAYLVFGHLYVPIDARGRIEEGATTPTAGFRCAVSP